MAEDYWKAQENRIRKLLEDRGWDANRQPGSGNLESAALKGDVYAEFGFTSLSIDHKSTRGEKSLTLKREDLQKQFGYADEIADIGIVTFGYYRKHDLYAVLPLSNLLDLVEMLERIAGRLEAQLD